MTMQFKSGFVALIGRPNVGKSTLLNQLMGKKISITSNKPQTTRQRLSGIITTKEYQLIFVDTPGLHRKSVSSLNKHLNRIANNTIDEVDVVIFVVEQLIWTEEDQMILDKLQNTSKPVILVINKVDNLSQKEDLLPYLEHMSEVYPFNQIIPLSAKKGSNVEALKSAVVTLLPEGPHLFADEQIVDRDDQFICAEFIREQLVRQLGQELPYATTVAIEKVEHKENIIHMHAIIWVERDNQKAIVIGKGGERLKNIASKGRVSIEKWLNKKVFLQVWVKVKDNWSNDESVLKQLGFE